MEVGLAEMEAGLAAAGVTKRGARDLFERAIGPAAAAARMRDAYALAAPLERHSEVMETGGDSAPSEMEPEAEWLVGAARVGADEVAGALVSGSDWAFLAELDPRTAVLWRIARRLAARELQHEDTASADDPDPDLWDGDALGVLAELLGMKRGDFVAEAGRLLSIETLRLARCSEPSGAGGRRQPGRMGLLRVMGAAVAAERLPLQAWRKAVQAARQARLVKETPAPTQATASVAVVEPRAAASLAAYDGDGVRPLAAKAIQPQIAALYQVTFYDPLCEDAGLGPQSRDMLVHELFC